MLTVTIAIIREYRLRNHTCAVSIIIVMSLASVGVRAEIAVKQEPELRSAFVQAKSGQLSDVSKAVLRSNPLLPWLQAINSKQTIGTASTTQILEVINANPNDPSSVWLLGQWRTELTRRQDWPSLALLDARFPDNSIATRCAVLLSVPDAERNRLWQENALAIWQTETKPAAHCQAVFDALNQIQPFSAQQLWQRFDRLLDDAAIDRLPELISRFSEPDASLARQYSDYLSNPQSQQNPWPVNSRSSTVLSKGLQVLSRKNTTQAELLFSNVRNTYAFSAEQNTAVQSEIALWSMVNYEAGADTRFFAVPEALRSGNLREWYMRFLFAQNDDVKTLEGFKQLLPAQQQEVRWLYFQARVLERNQQNKAAAELYRKASSSATFYGWLAAEKNNSAYALCPLEPTPTAKEIIALNAHPGMKRALWLWQLGEANYAIWEWNAAYKTLSIEQQRKAIEHAQKLGWYDRAVFSLENNDTNQRYYSLRFATPYLPQFKAASVQFGLNQSWLMAHARAESIFMPGVVSSANARGLLQLLPSTAEAIAAKNSLSWLGADSLYQPETNITLGAGALQDVIESYPNKAYQAIGAYNAGPTPVSRWQNARPTLEPAFWIETIPYKETREYITRVLAFSVLYDWRLNQAIVPLSQRLLGDFNEHGYHPKMSCPMPAIPNNKKP
jgi:soluble lytic murein transglycosylase